MQIGIYIVSLIMLTGMSSCKEQIIPSDSRNVQFLNSSVHFASVDESKKLLSTSDAFTQSQSPFDFASKTQNKASINESDYLEFAKSNALDWDAKEIEKTTKMIQEAEQRIKTLGLKIKLPKVVSLLKTTCNEEGGAAGYTREDYIVVSGAPDEHLFLHELFHIISRHNPILKNEIYQIIGFESCSRIQFPEYLKPLKITNPDAPFFDNYISLNIDGKTQDAIIVTLAKSDYDKGSFFQYLETKLMILEGDADNKQVKLENGKAILYDFADAADFLDQIGRNTGYNIHPEEISAEHFTMVVLEQKVKEPKYIDALKKVLL